jgi:uncharacterized membrane protein
MKHWYQSKTYWFNISLAIVGILELNLHLIQEHLGDSYGIVVIVVSIVGVMLRNVTTTQIQSKAQE